MGSPTRTALRGNAQRYLGQNRWAPGWASGWDRRWSSAGWAQLRGSEAKALGPRIVAQSEDSFGGQSRRPGDGSGPDSKRFRRAYRRLQLLKKRKREARMRVAEDRRAKRDKRSERRERRRRRSKAICMQKESGRAERVARVDGGKLSWTRNGCLERTRDGQQVLQMRSISQSQMYVREH